MQIDGYAYRKCRTCGERYYIREDETDCRSCRGETPESAAESDGARTESTAGAGRTEDAAGDGDSGTSSAIAMIKRANRGDDADA